MTVYRTITEGSQDSAGRGHAEAEGGVALRILREHGCQVARAYRAWQLYPFELPKVRTPDVDECVALIRDYTARLCAYTAVLDDLGVPRS